MDMKSNNNNKTVEETIADYADGIAIYRKSHNTTSLKEVRNNLISLILREYGSKKEPFASDSSFKDILMEMQELYERKNKDYGNSFSDTIKEFGFIPAVARINDKFNRVKNMVKGQQMNIKESLRDNLMDIANYCILTIIELDSRIQDK